MAADVELVAKLREGGMQRPKTTIAEARHAGLSLAVACALLEKESSGGQNVFGQDPTIFVKAGEVTREKYLEYKRQRVASGNKLMQGVGPCQLTWWEFQDAADEAGGCWKPELNIRVGFRRMADLIERNGPAEGARIYNGSGDRAVKYSQDLLARTRRWEQLLAGMSVPGPGPRLLRRGAEGELVKRLTRRLSFVHSRATGKPYLDGARGRFDRETEAALKAFQREHELDDDGTFGRLSADKLRKAVEREKRRREQLGGGTQPGKEPPAAEPARGDLASLVERALRTDRRHDAALEDLLAYGLGRRRQLKRLVEQQAHSPEALLSEIVAILLRIEDDVEELKKAEQQEPATAEPVALADAPGAPDAAAPVMVEALVEVPAASGGQTTKVPATVTQVEPPPPSAPEGPASPHMNATAGRAVALTAAALADLPDRAIAGMIREHDEAIDVARGVLVERFTRYEDELARLRPRDKRGKSGKSGGSATPGGPPAGGGKVKPGKGRGGGAPTGGSVADIRLGDQAHLVRASKIALSRFLAAKGSPEHVALRRALKREARGRKRGEIATRTWEKGVRASQHLLKREVTGVMDGELQRLLERYWPSDSAMRRLLRSSAGWRLIKGQVSPNFNLREFACKDGTPYVQGLVREQGLTEKHARARAGELAKRLERVRKAGGDRKLVLTSVYRTIAHNAAQPGSATNSSHLRGFAADIQPPAGVSLAVHRQHVRAAFEAGVGFYPPANGNFVHGDFDMKLGRRDWTP